MTDIVEVIDLKKMHSTSKQIELKKKKHGRNVKDVIDLHLMPDTWLAKVQRVVCLCPKVS